MNVPKRHGHDNYVVVLVHGTWAQDAGWMRDSSTFCTTLEDELKNLGAQSIVLIRDFVWSGLNTYRARQEAAAELNKKLYAVIGDFPRSSVFVVAHSHGGNVALRALRDSPRLKARISGVVCIATPFLKFFKARPTLALLPSMLRRAADRAWSWLPLWLIIVVVSHLWQLATSWLFGLQYWIPREQLLRCVEIDPLCHRHILYASLAVGALMGSLYTTVAILVGRGPVLKRSAPTAKTRGLMFRNYAYFQPEARFKEFRLLALSSALDEAMGGLTGAWWLHRVGRWMAFLTVWLGFAFAVLVIGLLIFGVFEAAMLVDGAISNYAAQRIAPSFLLVITLSVLVIVISAAIKWAARASTYLRPGLGFGHAVSDLYLYVRAYRSPGFGRPVRYGIIELLRGSRELLFHSRIYSFPPAIRGMARWMNEHAVTIASSERRDG